MERYVDGYVLPIHEDNIEEYQQMAQEAGEIWIEHGALAYYECVGDDLSPATGEVTMARFPNIAETGTSETVIFAFIIFESRAHRDAVNEKVLETMERESTDEEITMPFTVERMAYGGFQSLVALEQEPD